MKHKFIGQSLVYIQLFLSIFPRVHPHDKRSSMKKKLENSFSGKKIDIFSPKIDYIFSTDIPKVILFQTGLI